MTRLCPSFANPIKTSRFLCESHRNFSELDSSFSKQFGSTLSKSIATLGIDMHSFSNAAHFLTLQFHHYSKQHGAILFHRISQRNITFPFHFRTDRNDTKPFHFISLHFVRYLTQPISSITIHFTTARNNFIPAHFPALLYSSISYLFNSCTEISLQVNAPLPPECH